jgi:hypothetical protein
MYPESTMRQVQYLPVVCSLVTTRGYSSAHSLGLIRAMLADHAYCIQALRAIAHTDLRCRIVKDHAAAQPPCIMLARYAETMALCANMGTGCDASIARRGSQRLALQGGALRRLPPTLPVWGQLAGGAGGRQPPGGGGPSTRSQRKGNFHLIMYNTYTIHTAPSTKPMAIAFEMWHLPRSTEFDPKIEPP